MPFTLQSDLLKESGVQESGSECFVTRTFNVQVIGIAAPAAQLQCLNAPGIPQIGDVHPKLPFAICKTRNVRPNAVSSTECWVDCGYHWPKGIGPNQMRYEFGTVTRQINSSYTWDGELITASYQYMTPVKVGSGTSYRPQIDTSIADSPTTEAISVVHFTFYQRGNPGAWCQKVTNKVNDTFWEVGGGDPDAIGKAGYTWKCTEVQARILIYGNTLEQSWYEVTGTIEYNPKTWLEIVFYTDYTGHIPTAIAEKQPKLADLLPKVQLGVSVNRFNGYSVPIKYQPIEFNIWFPLNNAPPRLTQ